jgi:hypothetical protein
MSDTPEMIAQQRGRPTVGNRWMLAVSCLAAGIACLAGRWIPGGVAARVAYGLLVAAILLGVALLPSARWSAQRPRSLPFAFFIFAVVQVLNNSVPAYVAISVLHQAAVPGNPLASTVSGTVLIQLLDTALAVIPIVLLTRAAGQDLSTIYLRPGVIGRGLVIAIAVFVLCYLAAATGMSDRLFPYARPSLCTGSSPSLPHYSSYPCPTAFKRS